MSREKQLAVLLAEAVGFIKEFHEEEIKDDHYGDRDGTCSYCRLIEQASVLIVGKSP